MKKIIVNDCAQYFTALKEIKKGIKAQILDYDEDEEVLQQRKLQSCQMEFQSSYGQQI